MAEQHGMSLADPAYSTKTDDLHKMSILVLHNHASGFATMFLMIAVHCLTSACW